MSEIVRGPDSTRTHNSGANDPPRGIDGSMLTVGTVIGLQNERLRF